LAIAAMRASLRASRSTGGFRYFEILAVGFEDRAGIGAEGLRERPQRGVLALGGA
jgi:hypothetical protein